VTIDKTVEVLTYVAHAILYHSLGNGDLNQEKSIEDDDACDVEKECKAKQSFNR
jgi:hypothetical protein